MRSFQRPRYCCSGWRVIEENKGLLPRIICKIEKIQSEKYNPNEDNISHSVISDFYHLFSSKMSSYIHSNSKCHGVENMVIPLRKYPNCCTDKPKYCHCIPRRFSFECRKLENKSISKIIPNSWTCGKEIAKERKDKIGKIAKNSSIFSDILIFLSSNFLYKCHHYKNKHRKCGNSIHKKIRDTHDKKWPESSSKHHGKPESYEVFLPNQSFTVKIPYSSERITDFSEFKSDSSKLGRNPEKTHHSNRKHGYSSWYKPSKVRRNDSDKENDENFYFLGHK